MFASRRSSIKKPVTKPFERKVVVPMPYEPSVDAHDATQNDYEIVHKPSSGNAGRSGPTSQVSKEILGDSTNSTGRVDGSAWYVTFL